VWSRFVHPVEKFDAAECQRLHVHLLSDLEFVVWCLVFGGWCLVFGVWGSEFGVWGLGFGVGGVGRGVEARTDHSVVEVGTHTMSAWVLTRSYSSYTSMLGDI